MVKESKVTSTLAKSDDGSLQINFSIPFELIAESREKALNELSKEIEVPGFRKGNAPLDKVKEKVPERTLLEKTLNQILPSALSQAIAEHGVKPAIYPRFELIKTEEGSNWEIRAVTCEIPEVTLGDYKTALKGALASKKIWTPESGGADKPKEPTREEKEQVVITTLLELCKFNVPKVLVDEEVNSRLSGLLERIEKLGLNLDTYLSSIGKTVETLRGEYEKQSLDSIKLDLALSKIAQDEKLNVTEAQVDEAIHATSGDPNLKSKLDTPEQRRIVKSVLLKRASLEYLTSLM